jgi:hypothetical protein
VSRRHADPPRIGASGGTRTPSPQVRSLLLYPLSYERELKIRITVILIGLGGSRLWHWWPCRKCWKRHPCCSTALKEGKSIAAIAALFARGRTVVHRAVKAHGGRLKASPPIVGASVSALAKRYETSRQTIMRARDAAAELG